ncbi:MAG: hypothetical protein WC848_01880 [Parcubacteria group bacterium]|jgi:hypothetical protein
MNFKTKPKSFFWASALFMFFLPSLVLADASSFSYTPMEEIPGFSNITSYEGYILAIYKFGLWMVGISAVFMISIGAFMYITSAGNTSRVGKAKEIIFDAIAGVILALTSYVLLYTINPNLVNIVPLSQSGSNTTSGTGTGTGTGTGGSAGTGKCEPVTSGPCSVDSLTGSCFDGMADLSKISSLCNKESGGVDVDSAGKPTMSKVDKCTDGTSFSCGALQVNMTCTCKGKNAFTGGDPIKGCASFKCTGAGTSYQSCVDSNCSGSGNITAACQLYKEHSGNKYNTWENSNKTCGF